VAVSKNAAELGISAMPLSSCYLKPPAKGGLILGYGGTDAQQIRDGVGKLRVSICS
jgi:GntR family transcriptional regulator/MocR family aminotransferase